MSQSESTSDVVRFLVENLGGPLVAYMSKENSAQTVREWSVGKAQPDLPTERRLVVAYQVTSKLLKVVTKEKAQSWMQGSNPTTADESPARTIREGDPNDVYKDLVSYCQKVKDKQIEHQ